MCQRPETASGLTFVTLEDEHGTVNAVVWQRTAAEQRRELLESKLMAIDGRVERAHGVQHQIVQRVHNYGSLLTTLGPTSRDFH
jgi:error-prone DNA polymerase